MAAPNPADPVHPHPVEADVTAPRNQPAGESPMQAVFVSMSGMGASEHDTHPPGATADSVAAGHEPDRFNVKTILYVPLLVAVTVVVGFTIITTLFVTIVRKASPNGNTDPQSQTEAQKPINERFARISSTDPNAAIHQPRLEYLKQVDNGPDGKDPPHYRSKRPIEYAGATYEIRPEDLRPQNYIDPSKHRKILIETGYVDRDKKIVSIPIADAMELLVNGHKLPTRKVQSDRGVNEGTVNHPEVSDGRAKLSNAGRGGPSMPVAVTTPAKPADKPAH